MSVTEKLQEVLEGFGLRSWLMHTMPAEEEYPESFFTFLSIDAPFEAHYNNKPHSIVWAYWIGFYSSDPDKVNNIPLELATRLRAAGWVVPGLGESVRADEPNYTGRRITAYYVQKIDKEE